MGGSFRGKRFFMFLLMLLFVTVNTWAAENTAYFPLSKIRKGMRGTAYTVVSGTKVERFFVEFLGVLRGDGAVQNLLLVRVSGKALEEFGGIAAGMSGSPVFIRGKLVGAIGYGFQNADPQYGLVTPIAEMERLLEYGKPDIKQTFKWEKGGVPGKRGVVIGKRAPSSEWLEARPVATPLCITGLGERAYNQLAQAVPVDLLHPVRVPGASGYNKKAPKLKPGSALGVQLVTGDYQVTAIGTLTWIKGKQFLAFGHPFMNKGNVDYYVSAAEIFQTIPSTVFPFKIGEPLEMIGCLNQDRSAGIAGVFGQKPANVNVKVIVNDLAKHETETFRFYPVHDETLLKELVVSGALEAVDRVLDRIGTGTSRVQIAVEGTGFKPIVRTNLFYGQDVAASSFKELSRLLELLLSNEFKSVQISEIKLEVIVDPGRKTARIGELPKPAKKYFPGEKIRVDVRVRPYRDIVETIPVWITLPPKTKPGRWLLTVRGGGELGVASEAKQEEKKDTHELAKMTSLEGQISGFLSHPTNNMLIVEAISLSEGESSDERKTENQQGDHPVWKGQTSYYLAGESQMIIEVAAASPGNASGKNGAVNSNANNNKSASQPIISTDGTGTEKKTDETEDNTEQKE